MWPSKIKDAFLYTYLPGWDQLEARVPINYASLAYL